jgi:hypothetical protein
LMADIEAMGADELIQAAALMEVDARKCGGDLER